MGVHEDFIRMSRSNRDGQKRTLPHDTPIDIAPKKIATPTTRLNIRWRPSPVRTNIHHPVCKCIKVNSHLPFILACISSKYEWLRTSLEAAEKQKAALVDLKDEPEKSKELSAWWCINQLLGGDPENCRKDSPKKSTGRIR